MEKYLTPQIVEDVASEFTWPELYEVEDDLPDAIIMQFPECHLIITEEPWYGEVNLAIENPLTNDKFSKNDILPFFLHDFRVKDKPLSHLNFKETSDWSPSLEKVSEILRNHFIVIQSHLLPVIKGDFSWVNAHKEFLANKKRIQKALWNDAELNSANVERIMNHSIHLKLLRNDPSWKTDLEAL